MISKSIKLQASAIFHVPLDKYDKDFTFIVNGESFRTSKFVADLLSQKVSNYHSIDPTIDEIIISTTNRGNFEEFLKLQNFEENHLTEEESKFICEIIEQLETTQIKMNENRSEITFDNVIDRLLKDEKFNQNNSKFFNEEVKFISSNFSEFLRNQREKIMMLSLFTIELIINNPNLKLENEDELLKFINELYIQSNEYSILYEYVYFSNVESSTIEEFVKIFDINDINQSTWLSISSRLKEEIKSNSIEINDKRYKSDKFKEIEYKTDKVFDGIFKFLRSKSSINNEIKITASSVQNGNLEQIIQSDFPNNVFYTQNVPNSWVCIEFIKRRVIPTYYTLRSNGWNDNSDHPKNWSFEGSMDSENWEKLDSQKDCSFLNGKNYVHTFLIQNNNKPFKYFRIHQTGNNCANYNFLCFNCIELYGKFTDVKSSK